jgi:enterochelin esterase-like enzyme
LVLAVSALLLSTATLASEIVTREFQSKTLARGWKYELYLPSGYETSRLSYPVLYLLHGNNGSGGDWVKFGKLQSVADGLIAGGDMPPAVIVMPDAGVTWYVDRKEKMETALIRDLFPEIENSLRVLRSREGRLIGGLSMGGYGSLRLVLKYPEMFAAAALLSPAIYDPLPPLNSSARKVGTFGEPAFDERLWKSLNYPSLWPGYLAKHLPVPMYINSGDDDDFMIEADATRLYSLLRANKQPAELRIVDGAHTWAVWSSTLGDAMKYVFRFAVKPTPAE